MWFPFLKKYYEKMKIGMEILGKQYRREDEYLKLEGRSKYLYSKVS